MMEASTALSDAGWGASGQRWLGPCNVLMKDSVGLCLRPIVIIGKES